MKKMMLMLTVAATVLLVGCKTNPKKETGVMTASMIQEWFPFSGYSGELYAMYETDSLYNLDLTIKAGSDGIDPIKTVLGGTADFGVAGADRIITSNEKGADLVIIGVLNFHSPTCFLAKKEKNINTPKNFVGKRVGILTGTNTELIYQIMMKKQGIDRKTVTEQEAPFDLATFIADAYDCRPAFVFDEPVTLDKQKIAYTMIKPEDFGVTSFMGSVYFTTRKMVEEQPEKVQAFVNSIAAGWQKTLENPKKGIDYVKKFDKNIDVARETESLNRALPYFEGKNKQPLTFDEADFTAMCADLLTINAIKANPKKPVGNNSFINKFYKK
jgi:NitT/TauT family transport system substrate-binding protein